VAEGVAREAVGAPSNPAPVEPGVGEDLASASRVFGVFARHPQAATLTGAGAIAFSGILVRFAAVSPSTAATFRAAYALPFLAVVAVLEHRRLGPRSWRQRFWAYLAGFSFAVDLVLFHHGIELMGAGLATVMGNVQVIFVGAIAWFLLGERPSRPLLAGVPIALFGVFLISGVVGGGAYGRDPQLGVLVGLGTAAAYAGYLLLIRKGRDRSRVAGPIFDASLACAVSAIVLGVLWGDLNLVPSWPAHGWLVLLALSAQFAGGLLIAVALPRLPAVLTSLLLLTQPVLSVFLAMILVAETPSAFQLVGVLLVLVGVAVGTVPFRQLLARGRVTLG
jgi:drug/metabolite transporter (DMT)-like permease